MSFFDGSQKEVGRGAQAIVYYYNDFAYKVYNEDYSQDWIQGEFYIQNELCKTELPIVKYYKTDKPNILKMDFIDGVTLAERMLTERYENGLEDIISLQKLIHSYTNLDLPRLKDYALNDILQLEVDDDKKNIARKFLEDIPDKNNLLHLDFHFLNIMYAKHQYYIVDWINSRMGNPIFDYARSYVILNEFAPDMGDKYLSLITEDHDIVTTDLKRAIFVIALLRTKENVSDNTLALIEKIGKQS